MDVLPTIRIGEQPSLNADYQDVSFLTKEWRRQSGGGAPGGDPIIKAMSRALLKEVYDKEAYNETPVAQLARSFSDYQQIYNGVTIPSELANIWRACIVDFALKNNDALRLDFPYDGYDKWQRWPQLLHTYVDVLREDVRSPHDVKDPLIAEQGALNLMVRKATTCISERDVVVEAITQIMSDRFPEGVNLLAIGSSIMQGEIRMARKTEFPFTTPEVQTRSRNTDSTARTKITDLLQRDSMINNIVCLDLLPVYDNDRQTYDSDVLSWAKACLRPYTELSNPTFMHMFNSLATNKPNSIQFEQVDITNPEKVAKFKESSPFKAFDVVTLNTTMHQMSPEGQAQAMAHARELVSEDGIIIVADFMRHTTDPSLNSHPDLLLPYKEWHTGLKYMVYVYDQRHPMKKKPQEFARCNSRVTKLVQGSGKLLTQGTWRSVPDALAIA